MWVARGVSSSVRSHIFRPYRSFGSIVVNHLLREATARKEVAWRMHWWDFPSSHSSIIAAVEDGIYYFSSRRLWSAVCDKVFEITEHSVIEIHRQLCLVYGLTRLYGQHNACRSSNGKFLINIHPTVRTSRPVISIFSYISRNSCPVSVSVFRMTERRRWVSRWFQSRAADFYGTLIQKLIPRYGKCLNSGGEYVENSSKLAVSVPINLSIKLGFVSVKGTRETYFADVLRNILIIH